MARDDLKAGVCEETASPGDTPAAEDPGERWWRWACASAARDDREAAAERQRPGGVT